MQSTDQEGKTLDEALGKAIFSLKCRKEDIEYEILDEGSKGVFGVGIRPVLIRARLKSEFVNESIEENYNKLEIDIEEEIEEIDYNREEVLSEDSERIKKILNDFCNYLSLDLDKIEFSKKEKNIKIDIETEDANLLIGKHGKTLDSLQYLINQISHQDKPKFILDISNYKVKQNEKLMNLIKSIANRINKDRKKVTLNPMSSYDRKIVHEVIKEYPDLITKSIGIEPNRKVVIEHKDGISIDNFREKSFDKNRKNFSSTNKPFKKRYSENNSKTE